MKSFRPPCLPGPDAIAVVLVVAVVLGYLSASGGPCAASGDAATPQEVIDQWRLLFPGESYVCWQKESPWGGLDRLQAPPAGVVSLGAIHVDMGRNEYESTSFVLTSLADGPTEFSVTYDPIGISATLRKAVWVTVDDGSEVNDALSLIDNGRVVIPSGESLEIWITLHGNNAVAGTYSQTINVLPTGLAPCSVDIAVTVHDISLPDRLPLDLSYWDDVVPAWITPELVEAFMTDLKSHYVNDANIHPWPIPRFAVDGDGQLVTDYSELDRTLDGYTTLAPRRFIFFWNAGAFLEPSAEGRPEFMTPEWKLLFHEWLTGWVTHMKNRGIGYDGIVMHPYDEQGDSTVHDMLELIKEVDPNILVLFNGALGRTVEELEDLAPHVDVWLPHLYHYLDAGGVNGCISQAVPVDPDTAYTFSFYGKNGGANIYYDFVLDGSGSRYAYLLDATDWRQATHSFTTASNTTQVQVRFFPTVGHRTILIDDVVLSSGSGSNLVVNADMEAGSPPDSWGTTSAEVVADTTDPHSGVQCAKVTNIPLPENPAKEAAKRLLGAASGKLFWTYANPLGVAPTKASPYHYYRLAVWRAWKEGMTGFSYWIYKTGRWDSTGQGPNWAVVYLTNAADCPAEVSRQELVVPGKRWEATREGVEDYAYLHLLRAAISDSSLPPGWLALEKAKRALAYWTDEVLRGADIDDAELADEAKTEIVEAILGLTPRRPPNAATATGGTVVTNGNYVIHTFTNSGTFQVSGGTLSCSALVVGGGGGGGGIAGGAGGGAGGLIWTNGFVVPADSYAITVGEGGAGNSSYGAGAKGQNSVFSSLIAEGGGGGGGWTEDAGNGGSGGGGRGANTGVGDYPGGTGVAGQGFAGGRGKYTGGNGHIGGGGGGAGEPGGDATPSAPGDGGDGLPIPISGTIEWYAGGGGGNLYSHKSGAGGLGGGGRGSGSGFPADHGTPNTGGGGGGDGSLGSPHGGGNGGSGVVIVRYVLDPTFPPAGGAITMNGGYMIHTFTNSGVLDVYQGSEVCDILVVGGGGGGGSYAGGGGGGAGGLIYSNSFVASAGSYVVIVGDGGAGAPADAGAPSASNGGDSRFAGLLAAGGGGGACWGPAEVPGNGGSGGGGGSGGTRTVGVNNPGGSGVPGQGFDGGTGIRYETNGHSGGGGGGAGEAGGDGTSSAPGDGGDGLPFAISGTMEYYAGGGGGNLYQSASGSGAGGLGGGGRGSSYIHAGHFPADPGTPHTGGGGGGSGRLNTDGGGDGGSGIVIVRYAPYQRTVIVIR